MPTLAQAAADSAFDSLWGALLAPTQAGSLLYWPHVLGFLAFAVVALYLPGGPRPSVAGVARALFPRAIYMHPSARTDCKLYLVNQLLRPLTAATRLGVAVTLSTVTANALADAWPRARPSLDAVQVLGLGMLVVVGSDFGAYLNHRLHHTLPVLWPYHAVHHSAEVLTPMTVYRRHPVYDLINAVLKGGTIGLIQGVLFYATTGGADPAMALVLSAAYFTFTMLGSHLRHSHLWLSYGRVLGRVLISPAQHQLHHSVEERHRNVNHGEIFAVWDWLLGTLYVPTQRETFRIGLAEGTQPHDTLLRSLTAPFSESWRVLRRG